MKIDKTIKTVELCLEAESLKDVLWYISGRIEESNKNSMRCVFTDEHVDALELAIKLLLNERD